MKTLIVSIFALFFFNCIHASQPIEDQEKLVGISEEILGHLKEKEFDQTTEDFNDQMKNALTPEMLGQGWNGLVSQLGDFNEKGAITTDTQEGHRIVYIICKFEKGPVKLKIVFDDNDLVAALLLIPVNSK